MLVHSVLPRSAVNDGPGERVVIWFQGCDLRCPGCWNPSSHAFDRARDKSSSIFAIARGPHDQRRSVYDCDWIADSDRADSPRPGR